MRLRNWLDKKRKRAEKLTEQARAEILREQNKKSVKKGSMHHAYATGMKPFEFGKMKQKEYMERE